MSNVESEDLRERGLKKAKKFVVVFFDEDTMEWKATVKDTPDDADFCKGYCNYAGMSEVECIVPICAEPFVFGNMIELPPIWQGTAVGDISNASNDHKEEK